MTESSSRPVLMSVDDDPAVGRALARDLRRQYGSEYQIVRATSGAVSNSPAASFSPSRQTASSRISTTSPSRTVSITARPTASSSGTLAAVTRSGPPFG